MKRTLYWIIGIVLIVICVIYGNTYTKTLLVNENQINELEVEYNIRFDDIEWKITEYKQNNIIGKKKTII